MNNLNNLTEYQLPSLKLPYRFDFSFERRRLCDSNTRLPLEGVLLYHSPLLSIQIVCVEMFHQGLVFLAIIIVFTKLYPQFR